MRFRAASILLLINFLQISVASVRAEGIVPPNACYYPAPIYENVVEDFLAEMRGDPLTQYVAKYKGLVLQPNPPTQQEFYSKILGEAMKSRTIVPRPHGSTMPTWIHGIPALIVEPCVWYFDPNSRVLETNLESWTKMVPHWLATRTTANSATTHRSLIEFFLEDYDCLGARNRRSPGDNTQFKIPRGYMYR
jgi:hypothetical protein